MISVNVPNSITDKTEFELHVMHMHLKHDIKVTYQDNNTLTYTAPKDVIKKAVLTKVTEEEAKKLLPKLFDEQPV